MSLEETLAKRPAARKSNRRTPAVGAGLGGEWVRIGGGPDLARQTVRPTVVNLNGVAYVYGGDGANDVLIGAQGGTAWTKVTGNWPARAFTQGALHKGQFWIVGGFSPGKGFSDTLSSPDGVGWTPVGGAPGWGVRWAHSLVSYGGQLLLIGGVNGPGYADEVWALGADNAWRRISAGQFRPRAWTAATVLGDALLVMGGWDGNQAFAETMISTDGGVHWSTIKAPFGPRLGAVAVTVGDTAYLIGGDDWAPPKVRYSDVWATKDGVSWTRVDNSLPGRTAFGAAVIGGRIAVAGGLVTETSLGTPDMVAQQPPPDPHPRGWSLLSSNLPQDGEAASAALGEKLFVLGAKAEAEPSNQVSVSPDGQGWTSQPAPWPARRGATALVISDALYLAGGLKDAYPTADQSFSDIWATLDGVNWSQVADNAPWTGERGVQVTASGSRLIASGGLDAYGQPTRKLWSYTPQPVRWGPPVSAPISDLDYPAVAELGGVTYAICGRGRFGTDVYRTTDFVSFPSTRIGMAWPQFMAATVRDGKIWVVGGDGARGQQGAWWSTDGLAWTNAAPGVDLLDRTGHALVVFRGDLVAIGGSYTGPQSPSQFRAVCRSSDGASWTGVECNLDPRRSNFAAAVLGDTLWVFGGSSSGQALNEAWCTRDLVTWEQHTPPWAGRYFCRAHLVNDVLYLLGGVSSGSQTIYRDVWATRDGIQWLQVDNGGPGQYGGGSVVRDTTVVLFGGFNAPGQGGDVFRYLTPDT